MKRELVTTQKIHRWLCTIVMLFASIACTMANTYTYYFRAEVSVSQTGSGLVYVNTETTDEQYYQETSSVSDDGEGVSVGFITSYPTTDLYLYAQEADGWLFERWEERSGRGTWLNPYDWKPVGTNNPQKITEKQFTSTSESSPTIFTYRAVFTKQNGAVKVQVAESGRGTVSINNSNNQIGDRVVLTANPDASNGYLFLGWNKNKNDKENFITTDNPYSFTVSSSNAGTYYAHFSEAPEVMYCRIKNKATGRFLTLYDNAIAGTHKRDYTLYGRTVKDISDGFIFTNSLKLVDASTANGNPMSVFQRNGHPAGTGITNQADLVAHDIQYSDLVTEDHTTNLYPLTMETLSDGSVQIYTNYTTTIEGVNLTLRSYLCDENSSNGWAVMKSLEDLGSNAEESAKWIVYLLDEDTKEGSFGANAKANYSKDNYYYTTMYSYFPYKVLDGVNAYYLPRSAESYNEDTHIATFKRIESGIVPAYTAVVLECPAVYNGVNNRLLPIQDKEVSENISSSFNLLKGYVSIFDKDANKVNTVENNTASMFVLSSKNNILGFYHYSKSTMTPNKAYLDLGTTEGSEEIESFAKSVIFSFGHNSEDIDTPTNIKLSEEVVGDEDEPVFDLNGRKVAEGKDAEKLLRQGIYVKKGKKFVVK